MDTFFIETNGRRIFCKAEEEARQVAAYYRLDCFFKNFKKVAIVKKRKKRATAGVKRVKRVVLVVPPVTTTQSKTAVKALKPKNGKYVAPTPMDNIPGWSKIRKHIMGLDDYTCRICFNHNHNDLIVHHIDYDRTNNEDDNLVTLCEKCHRALHLEGYKPELYPDWPVPWKLHRE